MKVKQKIFILFLILLMTLSGCHMNNSRIEKQFEDGSKLIRINNYSCFHKLYDDLGIYTADAINQIAIFPEKYFPETFDTKWTVEPENIISKRGFYVKYAYSDDGFIAYYDYDKKSYTGEYCIFSVDEKEELRFNSITELYKYTSSENIELEEWYYSLDFALCQEKQFLQIQDWSVVTVEEFATVRNGYEDMFSGKIDKYIAENDCLAFHIDINGSMESNLRAFGNPILKCEEENIIGYTFLFKIPIYYDHYIVVNCKDDSYEIFETKKDAENFLSSKGIDTNWKHLN